MRHAHMPSAFPRNLLTFQFLSRADTQEGATPPLSLGSAGALQARHNPGDLVSVQAKSSQILFDQDDLATGAEEDRHVLGSCQPMTCRFDRELGDEESVHLRQGGMKSPKSTK